MKNKNQKYKTTSKTHTHTHTPKAGQSIKRQRPDCEMDQANGLTVEPHSFLFLFTSWRSSGYLRLRVRLILDIFILQFGGWVSKALSIVVLMMFSLQHNRVNG